MKMFRIPSMIRSALSELKKNHDDTFWWRTAISRVTNRPFHTYIYPRHHGMRVMEEDWDNLIVLDACRADLFEEVGGDSLFDSYRTGLSLGSATPEWTKQNFAGEEFGDTVYVTGNPFASSIAGESFHQTYDVWKDHFDEHIRTVLPEAMVEQSRIAFEDHPNKRIVIHMMQPHIPFVTRKDMRYSGQRPERILGKSNDKQLQRPRNPWDALELGVLNREDVWQGYRENLEYVLGYVTDLIEELPGRSVITSDHGNLLGERGWPVPLRLYGHPNGLRYPELVKIPWAVAESKDGTRRRIICEDINKTTIEEKNEVRQKLKDLGYHG